MDGPLTPLVRFIRWEPDLSLIQRAAFRTVLTLLALCAVYFFFGISNLTTISIISILTGVIYYIIDPQ